VDYFTFCYLPIYQSFVFQIRVPALPIQNACVLICCFFPFFWEGTVYTHV